MNNADQDALANLIGSIGVIVAAVGAVLCVLLYARVQWWKSEMGRHLMSYQVVIALTLLTGTLRFFVGDNDFWRYTRLIVFLGVPVVIWWRCWLIWKAHHDR